MTNLEEVDPADEARTYRQAPFRQPALVAVAGSAMHFVMAFVLACGACVFWRRHRRQRRGHRPASTAVGHGHATTPARAAGGSSLGDVVVAVDGRPVTDPGQFEQLSSRHAGQAGARHRRARRRAGCVHRHPGPGQPRRHARRARPGSASAHRPHRGHPRHARRAAVIRFRCGRHGRRRAAGRGCTVGLDARGLGQLFSPHGLSNVSSDHPQVGDQKAADNPATSGVRPSRSVGIVPHRHPGRPGRPALRCSGARRDQHLSSGSSTCSRCCPSTAATWSSPCTSGSAAGGGRPLPRRRHQAPAGRVRRSWLARPVPRGQRPVPRHRAPGGQPQLTR